MASRLQRGLVPSVSMGVRFQSGRNVRVLRLDRGAVARLTKAAASLKAAADVVGDCAAGQAWRGLVGRLLAAAGLEAVEELGPRPESGPGRPVAAPAAGGAAGGWTAAQRAAWLRGMVRDGKAAAVAD